MHYPVTDEKAALSELKTIITENEYDPEWDEFVQRNPAGFHEQTSIWGSVKRLEGWSVFRVKIKRNLNICAGFQILWKKKSIIGRIGYLSKGPLIDYPDPDLWNVIISQLKRTVRDYRIRALVIIPGFYPSGNKLSFDKKDFFPGTLLPVIDTSLHIDLTKPEEYLLKSMRRSLRKDIKNQEKLKFREGNENDLAVFFELMVAACRRQGTPPNPPSYRYVKQLWRHFSPAGLIKLYIAENRETNEIITASMALIIRDVFIAWKIGWSGEYSGLNANSGIIWHMITKAKEAGYAIFDFVSVDYDSIMKIRKKEKLNKKILQSPTFFKSGFGGDIVRFPPAKIYIPGRILSGGYKLLNLLLPLFYAKNI